MDRFVKFLGKQDHVERLIPRMHALHLPSETEAFGLAALEAMACGVPPVATRTGGVPDLITHGVDGFMEPVGDIEAQAGRLVALLTDADLHARMARRHVKVPSGDSRLISSFRSMSRHIAKSSVNEGSSQVN